MSQGKTNENKRVYIFIALVALIFFGFGANLFRLQVLKGEDSKAAVNTVKVSVDAPRGEILDRNGLPLVYNRQANNIIFDYNYFPTAGEQSKRVEIIDKLIKLFDAQKAQWKDDLPIVITKSGAFKFKKNRENDISFLKSADFLNLNSYATAENCFNALVERYALQDYDVVQARKIASVCYNLRRLDFSPSIPYVFAEDVKDSLVAQIKENSEKYTGVDVQVGAVRDAFDSTAASNILGIVGLINAEEYAEYKDSGYGYNDMIGKSGIELAMEDTLRGTKGVKSVYTDSYGNKTSALTTPVKSGNSVELTLDRGLQRVAQSALEKRLEELQELNQREYKMCGSVVALDVNNGEVLCSCTAPTYNLSTYYDDADKLNKDESAPLWNRVLQSTYSPGSTIKLAVAMGALENGIIDASSKVLCEHVYTYYEDYQPTCIGYHGMMDVVNGIYNSCNIFFYEVSRLMGITALNKYFSVFGLGEKTGVELSEAEGTVDSVAYRESTGVMWTPGLTVQAGIGHGANLFTPIQLCNYAAMVATRGTRYKPHYVKSVVSYDKSTVISITLPEILAKVNFKKENWDLVHQGTWKVANEGTADFTSVPVTVGAKTGTTTINKLVDNTYIETNNGVLIAFAPFENPQIAVCTVVEGASSGSSTAPIVSAIMEYYFSDLYGTGELPDGVKYDKTGTSEESKKVNKKQASEKADGNG
ncbi:MAG: hypothetical protein MJ177_06670 [Clostridia bacterium]|nr:hypothetical protein [Clostridia bacterium]